MRASRIPLAYHGALDLGAGLALMAAPFVLAFNGPATFIALALGALLVGLGFSATGDEGRGTLTASAHAAYDLGLAIGLIIAGFAVGVVGDVTAFTVLAALGVAGLLLAGFTRYSPRLA